MNIAMFYHSLVSDWNHGNAHFLRGVAGALRELGHGSASTNRRTAGASRTCAASRRQADRGVSPLLSQSREHPYRLQDIDLDETLSGADLVWSMSGTIAI